MPTSVKVCSVGRFEHLSDDAGAEADRYALARHVMVIADAAVERRELGPIRFAAQHPTAFQPGMEDPITAFMAQRRLTPNAVTLGSWDYARLAGPSASRESSLDLGQVPTLEAYDGAGSYRYPDTAAAERAAVRSLAALELGAKRLEGLGAARILSPGARFSLIDHASFGPNTTALAYAAALLASHDRADNAFTVLAVEHEASNNLGSQAARLLGRGSPERGTYKNRFSCALAAVPVVPRHLPSPMAPAALSARVVGVDASVVSADRGHRVKVQMHFQRGEAPNAGGLPTGFGSDARGNAPGDERSGTWVRVAGPAAGANWGSVYTPRIGSEVAVHFIEGDIDRPVVSVNSSRPPRKSMPRHPSHPCVRATQCDNFSLLARTDTSMDIAHLLAPITVARPGGVDLSFTPEIDAIQEMRREDDPTLDQGAWIAALKSADWSGVERSCAQILTTKSKDLRVAGWLVDAWSRLHGFEGLGDGLDLAAGLVDAYWDQLHPLPEDGDQEQRIGNLRWLTGRVEQLAPAIPLAAGGDRRWTLAAIGDARARRLAASHAGTSSTPPETNDVSPAEPAATLEMAWRDVTASGRDAARGRHAQVTRARAALQRLQAAVDARLGDDAPSFVAPRAALDSVLEELVRLERECGLGTPTPDDSAAPDPGAGASSMAGAAGVSVAAAPGLPGRIETRAQAIGQLRGVAAFFRATEPHSPVAYLADKAVRWSEMPLHEWLRAVVKDGVSLHQLEDMLGVDKPPAT